MKEMAILSPPYYFIARFAKVYAVAIRWSVIKSLRKFKVSTVGELGKITGLASASDLTTLNNFKLRRKILLNK